jgi:NAD(P)-dependent dehydrogenase (short-subunit alcohol dehydrogenase family)
LKQTHFSGEPLNNNMANAYLVIGAAGGIGAELSRRLVGSGNRVLLCGRAAEPLAALASELDQPMQVLDAKEWQSTADAVEKAVALFGKLDGAVNLAGSLLLKPAHLTTFEDWIDTIHQNLTTAMGLVKAAAPAMRKTGGGSIVLMSSGAASIGLPSHEAIAAAKAGVEGLVRSAAATYAAANVRVNAVAPGLTQTPLTRRVWENEKGAEASRSMHPLGRLGNAGDIASAIAWLLSPEQTWITAQTIAVDGGLSTLKTGR